MNRLPPPAGDAEQPLQALIFDSPLRPVPRNRGAYPRFPQGTLKPGDLIMFMSNGACYKVEEVGIFQIQRIPQKSLTAGQVGYFIAGIKTVSDTRSGDTVTLKQKPCKAPLPGFRELKPVVFFPPSIRWPRKPTKNSSAHWSASSSTTRR